MAVQKAIIILALASLQANAAKTRHQDDLLTEACHDSDESDEVTLLATKAKLQEHTTFDSMRISYLKFPMKDSELSLLAEGEKANLMPSNHAGRDRNVFKVRYETFRASALRQEHRKEGNARLLYPCNCTDEAGKKLYCFSNDATCRAGVYTCDGEPPSSLHGDLEQTSCVLTGDANSLSQVYMVESIEDAASHKLAVSQISEMAKSIGEKSMIALRPDMHKDVLAALEGHAAKQKVTFSMDMSVVGPDGLQ